MRIFLSVWYYEPGGFSTVLNMLSKYLKRHGMDVTVAARVIRMQAPNYVNLIRLTPEELISKGKDYDIIHIHTSYPYTRAAIKHGLVDRVVFTWHGYAPLKYVPGISNKVIGLYIKHIGYKSLIPKIRYITTISEYAQQQLRELYGVDAVIIPNGVELHLFSKCESRDLEERYGGYEPIIFNATAYNKLKGGDILIKYFKIIKKRFPKALLMAVGIQRYVKELSDDYRRSIVNLSIMPFEELVKYYCISHFYLFTSRIESFGLPIIESFAAGKPVIALDKPDARREHILNSGAGVLFRNEDELLRAVDYVLKNYDYLSRRAVEYARKFDWDVVAKQYIEVYRGVLNA